MEMIKRPRRLRSGEYLRKMVRETRMDKSSLIYPLFVQEGVGKEEEIPSMPGQFRYSLDRLPYELERLSKAGVGSVMLFGIPDKKDAMASQAGGCRPVGMTGTGLSYRPAISWHLRLRFFRTMPADESVFPDGR